MGNQYVDVMFNDAQRSGKIFFFIWMELLNIMTRPLIKTTLVAMYDRLHFRWPVMQQNVYSMREKGGKYLNKHFGHSHLWNMRFRQRNHILINIYSVSLRLIYIVAWFSFCRCYWLAIRLIKRCYLYVLTCQKYRICTYKVTSNTLVLLQW